MSLKALGIVSLCVGMAVLAGCGEEQLKQSEVKTLETNLNKPVDVEKIRAEYEAQKNSGGGSVGQAAPGGP